MFDATNGKKVFELLYERVLMHNAPQLWYKNGYFTDECWEFAADNVLAYLADNNLVGNEDKTDLMAYIIECNPDNIDDAFGDGFGYLLGSMMQNEYEMGE